MSDQQKRGFRLPWAAERGADEESDPATDKGTLDSDAAAVGVDPGEGPSSRAEADPAMKTDATPVASDVPEDDAEAEMIDTDAMQERIERATGDGVWPTSDHAAEDPQAADPPPAPAGDSGNRPARRENPLVAGLVKAMREAALASRAETTTRLQAEAAARIEAIRAESTDEAAALRKRVDEDIAGIRDWSKVEMARIRAETEHRIEERRADAINESQRHLDTVEELVGRVQSTISTFEADMDRFFERLLAETDPARLASLAEQAPEPPDLSGELPKATGWTSQADDEPASAESDDGFVYDRTDGEPAEAQAEPAGAQAEPTEAVAEPAEAEAETAGPDAEIAGADAEMVEAQAETVEPEAAAEPLQAEAAAEAEAAATEGLDLSAGDDWSAAMMAAMRRSADRPEGDAAVAEKDGATSKVLVSGLTSVAGISAFKGAVGGLSGVRSVSVSTGERGVFIFSVSHEPGVDLGATIAELSQFAVQITSATADSLSVTAHEPAA